MNVDDFKQALSDRGYRGYATNGASSFEGRSLTDAAYCECNDRPPALHVNVYPPFRGYRTGHAVVFKVFGQRRDGRWLEATLYSHVIEDVGDFEAVMDNAEVTAAAVWQAFYETSDEEAA